MCVCVCVCVCTCNNNNINDNNIPLYPIMSKAILVYLNLGDLSLITM